MIFSAVPNIEIKIISFRENVLLGENYNLTCTITGADKLSPTISYEWIQNETLLEMVDSSILSFSPFKLSHAGNYSCIVNITSNYVEDIITMTSDIEPLVVQSRLSVPISISQDYIHSIG